ncbi:MAG: MscL family protein, partial [Actinomycetota bacterium]
LVADFITPLIAIPGKANFSSLHFTIRHSTFLYGHFINVLLAFVAIAAAVFFFVVKPLNAYMARRNKDVDSPTKECPHCISQIPVAATVCAFCTREVPAEKTVA